MSILFESHATQATHMPSRYRSDLKCTDNTLTRRGSIRCSRSVKNKLSNEIESCGDHCVSLDTDRRRRRKEAEEDRRVHLRGKTNINQKKFEVECLLGLLQGVLRR